MKDCIFCQIVKGEAESSKVYEDDNVIAFLDVNPASLGHTLIVPKKHYKDIYEISGEELGKIVSVIKKLSDEYKKKLDIKELNLLHASGKNAQQSVFHFHIHLIPRTKDDKLDLWFQELPELKPNFENILKKLK